MPEGLEVEYYRGALIAATGRRIDSVTIPEASYVRNGRAADVVRCLRGSVVAAVRRRGKLLLVDLVRGGDEAVCATVGLRFGMTGRLVVDGACPIDRLEYASGRDDPRWDRFTAALTDGGSIVMRDQRRLGSVELAPDEGALGPDMCEITAAELASMLARSSRPLKARLMDQAAVAGLGNLLTDEILWRAGLHPARPASSLGDEDVARLWDTMASTLVDLAERGGSHTGDLFSQRNPSGRCPRDGAALERRTLAGRTTYACPNHQAGPE